MLIKILFTVSLFGELFLSVYPSVSDAGTFFVSSKPLECLSMNISFGGSCKTINEYAFNDSKELASTGNVIMLFLPGVHNLTRNLTIKGKMEFYLAGNYEEVQTIIYLHEGSITIRNVSNFKLSTLSINGLSKSAVSIRDVLDVMIENVVITSSAFLIQCLQCNNVIISNTLFIGSVLVIAWPEYFLKTGTKRHAYDHVLIQDTVFHLSLTGNGLSCCNVHSLVITNTSMSNNHFMPMATPPETSLITFCHYFPWGIVFREVCDLLTASIDVLKIYNSTFVRTSGTGLCVSAPFRAAVFAVNSTISYHTRGGATFNYDDNAVNVFLINCSFSNNSNTLSGPTTSSALSVYTTKIVDALPHEIPKLFVSQTHFVGNRHLVVKPISTVSIASHVLVAIEDSNFTDNYGSAITAYTTDADHVLIRFLGKILFRNNTSHRGGAIHLFKSRIGLERGVSIHFEENHAKDVGGAIYVHSTRWLSYYYELKPEKYGDCFYVLMNCDKGFAVTFVNNSAKNGGEHLFGASALSVCNLCPLSGLAASAVNHRFHFSHPNILAFSSISSHPSRVCVCDTTLEFYTPRYFCANASLIFLSRSVYPGEEFSLEVVLVGVEFGTGTGSVYAQLLSPSSSELHPQHQYSQRVEDFKKCTQLRYTVYSSNSQEVLVLMSTDETVLQYGDQKKVEEDLYHVHEIMYKTLSPLLLTTPVYINLTLLPCPQGFILTGSPPKCDCVRALIANNIFCNFTNGVGYVYHNDTMWVGILVNNDSIILQRKCPFDYCRAEMTGIDFRDPDTQCAMNHAGTLCGQCRNGFSLALGTNMCVKCGNNKGLGLIMFFLIAGILLVLFLKLLNITVSQGTINGLIFYANIIWAYQDVFFTKPTNDVVARAFIAWLNLDFGINMCFVQGLTAYGKTWLQFAFPFYIWSIAGAMIILAHYSKMMTKLFGNNCVQVLATLFLLSYAKIFRTIITIMVPAILQLYPVNSTDASGISIVWAFDGNLSYGGNPHGFLLVTALLMLVFLWLPYTTILLAFRVIMKGSSHKCLRWINRIIPLIETYFGPLKMSHYYWVGLLLLVRGILLIIFTLTYTTSPSASLLSLAIIIPALFVLLTYTGRVYQNRLVSLLECSFLVNLQVLSVTILFIDLELNNASKDIAIRISVIVAFIQFLGIIFFHVYQLVKNNSKVKCCCLKDERVVCEVETNGYSLIGDVSRII